MKFETEVVNIEKMGRRKRYEASEQQEYKEAKIVSGGHMDGSKRSRPDLTSTAQTKLRLLKITISKLRRKTIPARARNARGLIINSCANGRLT
jgi:hypothetical protein